MGGLSDAVGLLREDLQAARERDPSARSLVEIALGYPGLHAVWCHRLVHRMWHTPGLRLPARLLSQGQRRRVSLARLFLAEAQPLWLLDEPFTALDVAAVAELAALLDAHCARGGAVVFSSHQDAAFATPLHSLNVEDFAP